jgi:16S rRNA (guanine527-N7)-methyltransferase
MLDILAREAPSYGVRLSDGQLRQFEWYLDLLRAWSPHVNLVGDASPDVVQRRHFLESLALGAALRERDILRPDSDVLDLGAGAGFPGVTLKIAWPRVRLTLLEATAKKAAFLSALVDRLGLGDTAVLTGRAEELAHDPALRERFDLVVARAVAPLRVLVELALPFARVGGRLASPKGSRAPAEVEAAANALRTLSAEAIVAPFPVPGPVQRLVVVVKRAPTSRAYPRRPGMPAKNPL